MVFPCRCPLIHPFLNEVCWAAGQQLVCVCVCVGGGGGGGGGCVAQPMGFSCSTSSWPCLPQRFREIVGMPEATPLEQRKVGWQKRIARRGAGAAVAPGTAGGTWGPGRAAKTHRPMQGWRARQSAPPSSLGIAGHFVFEPQPWRQQRQPAGGPAAAAGAASQGVAGAVRLIHTRLLCILGVLQVLNEEAVLAAIREVLQERGKGETLVMFQQVRAQPSGPVRCFERAHRATRAPRAASPCNRRATSPAPSPW